MELIVKHPAIGKHSSKKENIQSIIHYPHNQLFCRVTNNNIEMLYIFTGEKTRLKNHISIIEVYDLAEKIFISNYTSIMMLNNKYF